MKLNKIISIFATLSIIAVVAVFTISNYSTGNNLFKENVEALASDPIYCDGGQTECARIIAGSTTHLFYKPAVKAEE